MLPSNASDWDTSNPIRKKDGPRWVGLAVMVCLLVVLGGVIYVAVTRLPTTLTRPGATTSTAANRSAPATAAVPTPAGVPADTATQQAIQQVVQSLDDAQAEAIATQNPNVMAATATPEFYAQEVSSNQDLVDSGVTDIKMVKAEFSQASIDGNTATMTVYETWTTSFQDGTTTQARDRNIYTLVQDNGTWKVQTDDHPDDPAATGTPGATGP